MVLKETCFEYCNDENYDECEECLNDHVAGNVGKNETKAQRIKRGRWCRTCEIFRSFIDRFYRTCYNRVNDAGKTIECVIDLTISQPLLCIDCVPSSICYFNPKSKACGILKNRSTYINTVVNKFADKLKRLLNL